MKRIMARVGVLVLAVFTLAVPSTRSFADDGFYVIASGGGTKGRILKTEVFTSNYIDNTPGTETWEKLPAVQWSYTKMSPTSKLIITYQDCLRSWSLSFDALSAYQIRVNDLSSDAGANAAYLSCVGSASVTGVWSNIPAGTATLSIWHIWKNMNPSTDSSTRNYAGMITTVIVTEIEP